MDPDADPAVQSILNRFQAFPKQPRQAVYRGILERLRPEEWRQVKAHADRITFQCDFLDKLPPEIAVLVVQQLSLIDLVRLQRVSRRWQEILSSSVVRRAVVRSTLGRDPWTRDPPLSSHAAAEVSSGLTAGPKDAHSYSPASFTALVQQRRRLEQGEPVRIIGMPSPLNSEFDPSLYARGWDGRTSISLLDLSTGESTRLTTDNREQLVELRFSAPTIAAVSTRAYCHVWNLDTKESASFRIPSAHYRHFLVNGSKVALSYRDYVVHWSFRSTVAHTVKTGSAIVVLALHPREDQFTVVRLSKNIITGDSNTATTATTADMDSLDGALSIDMCQLHTEKYSLDHDRSKFRSIFSLDQPFPGPEICKEWIKATWFEQEIYRGQSCAFLENWDGGGADQERSNLYLSLEGDQSEVAIHTLPAQFNKIGSMICPEKGILYALAKNREQYAILETKLQATPPTSHSCLWYQHPIVDVKDLEPCSWVFGDGEFILFLFYDDLEIWAMNEAYLSKAVSLMGRLGHGNDVEDDDNDFW
ncbi:hypothetical protein N7462_006318 [Penicillium macrosclerotiorum]|uniref:uncharacterized protein n=1 Tax=Penicillium macrosclerotiorum TaxID=303699 RepID=UPI002547B2E4|nr:uncharacterized protein N7462_006318 [Penicillium macrosclerotiorum]KAJ5683153.1 hypothetical protein N7462_006318 [Penicillium macrosclerotiorum]